MIRIPLPDDSVLVLTPRWQHVPAALQIAFLAALVLVPAGLALALYRRELRLVSRRMARCLLAPRLALLASLWVVIAWQPAVVHESIEDRPGRVIIAVDQSGSMDVSDSQRTIAEKLKLARALKITAGVSERLLDEWIAHFERDHAAPIASPGLADILRDVDRLTRAQTAGRILTPAGADLLRLLSERHKVEIIRFGAQTDTDLRRPLLEALEKSGTAAGTAEGRLLGVILLTDGIHNRAGSPWVQAEELGTRRIPVYPIALGQSRPPPDVAVLDVRAPHHVLKDVPIPVQTRIKVTGLPAQEIRVELLQAGKPADPQNVRIVNHDGTDRIHEFLFEATEHHAGLHQLEVKATPVDPQTREITRENNVRAATVRVTDDKIRVLLVDGEARWEYQYLANALGRDKTVDLDRVVFIQPRVGQLPDDKLEKLGHPRLRLPAMKNESDDPLAKYHCIVLGDVLPEHLSLAERRRLARYVADRGGTVVFVAGKRAMPLAFLHKRPDDPLVKLLPITQPRVLKPESGFSLNLTPDGMQSAFMQLGSTPQASAQRWAELPKHYWAIVGRAKPGADALAFVEDKNQRMPEAAQSPPERRQALIVQQQYGFGRVLFVGVDSTWRWRYRVGDKHHHRFWTQVIRWAASDQLLPAGNRQVRFGSRKAVCRHGDDVEIAVRLGDDVPPLTPDALARARLVPLDKGEAAVVSLRVLPDQPRLLEGRASNLKLGSYRIELDIPDLQRHIGANKADDPRRDQFSVVSPEDVEMLDLATDWALLENLAARSGGKVFAPEAVQHLVDRLTRQTMQLSRREPSRLWQDAPLVWWLLAAILILLSAEWLLRKTAGLP